MTDRLLLGKHDRLKLGDDLNFVIERVAQPPDTKPVVLFENDEIVITLRKKPRKTNG